MHLYNKTAAFKACSSTCPDLGIKAYEKLVNHGQHKILVLLMNRLQINRWHNSLKTEKAGPLHLYTYFGFVQRELTKYWPLAEKYLPPGQPVLSPIYLTMETAQYLTATLVENYRQRGYLRDIISPVDRLAMQIADSRGKAALNGLDWQNIGQRLKAAWSGAETKTAVFEQAQEIIGEYRAICLQQRILDYPLAVEIYNRLLADQLYRQHLNREFNHLIVENLEETAPAAQDLISVLLEEAQTALLIYVKDGGHGIFFGADPFSAKNLTVGLSQESYPDCPACSEKTYRWAEALKQAVKNRPTQPQPCPILGKPVFTDLRSEMIREVGQRLLELLRQGIPARQIVLIAPHVDKVLEFSLNLILAAKGYRIDNITRSRRLLDEPFTLALITLAVLAHPEWTLQAGFGDLAETLRLILSTDPVRAGLLAELLTDRQGNLPVPDIDLQARIGPSVMAKYNLLSNWLADYRSQPGLTIEAFLQRVFGEILSPLAPAAEQIYSCRQLLASAIKFSQAIESLPELFPGPAGKYFIEMIKQGTVAAETLEQPEPDKNSVILATPYAYLLNCDSSRVQFWLDSSGEAWFNSDARELSNPHVLSRRWVPGTVWTGDIDQVIRLDKAARTVGALAHRCQEKLITAGSTYSSFGWEQFGRLQDIIEQTTDFSSH
ncbi:hypothetical protein Dtox_3947 [Desulfofarcimen acetoxidans DSM 771]|uniref:Uncharacterized protein n=1 Tax=Desulfofarcimen acetoxidans (strain ATCC 49208 / DSM 771 / KCTC 5769 / VKM B-1644 / 5575) TaxID=485916 RepID=C8VY11_DESAS|nr:hypothetical protein [Desulfofarcimen acetoxidans]ACV64640.1 hypothetical protein Dtox_3947 [Desulfofarcimen acetoxidans DSM 771]